MQSKFNKGDRIIWIGGSEGDRYRGKTYTVQYAGKKQPKFDMVGEYKSQNDDDWAKDPMAQAAVTEKRKIESTLHGEGILISNGVGVDWGNVTTETIKNPPPQSQCTNHTPVDTGLPSHKRWCGTCDNDIVFDDGMNRWITK